MERAVCNTSRHLQALITVSCASRAEVDALVKLATDNDRGKAAGEPHDHLFMYDWSFYDLDGHGWGVVWIDDAITKNRAHAHARGCLAVSGARPGADRTPRS